MAKCLERNSIFQFGRVSSLWTIMSVCLLVGLSVGWSVSLSWYPKIVSSYTSMLLHRTSSSSFERNIKNSCSFAFMSPDSEKKRPRKKQDKVLRKKSVVVSVLSSVLFFSWNFFFYKFPALHRCTLCIFYALDRYFIFICVLLTYTYLKVL